MSAPALALVRPADDPVSARPAVPHLRLVPAPDPDPATDPEPETLAPGKRGRQTTPRRRADTCESSQNSAALLTPEEAAEILRISARTLSNWRALGKGPPYRKVGGRVVYPRATMLTWGLECPGFGQQGRPQVKVTTRPYAKDPSRSHVDIMFAHPTQPGETYRKRIVAPAGMDPRAAQVWGDKQGQEILYALIRGATPAPARATVDADATAEREAPTAKHTSKPAPSTAPAPEVITLADLWERFAVAYVADLKVATRHNYRTAWSHLGPLLGATPIEAITSQRIAKLRNELKPRGVHKAGSRNTIIDKLTTALKWAMTQGDMTERAIKAGREKSDDDEEKRCYTAADVDRMLDACESVNDTLMILLCYDGALRIGETAGLMWRDVNFAANTITVCRNVSCGELQRSAKGKSGTIPMTLRLAKHLRAAREISDSPYVVCNPDGSHTTDWANQDRVTRLQKRAGLDFVAGPHRLRHSALTRAAEHGASPYALQAFARHADLQTTMRFYVHLNSANTARAAVAVFDTAPSAPL